VQPLWKSDWRVLKRLKLDLLYESAVPFLGIYLKECKSIYRSNTFTLVFIAALFTIVELWNQSKCPTTDEWMTKMWNLYMMEYYLAIKKNEVMSFSRKWMELEIILLSEIRQAQKAKHHIFVEFRAK
jgi:hypothetical protein